MIKKAIYCTVAAVIFLAGCGTSGKLAKNDAKTPEYTVMPPPEEYSDSMAASYYYLQGVKISNIYGDAKESARCLELALRYDSLHSPSYYELATVLQESDPVKALDFSRRANSLDSENIWYKLQLGQLYINAEKYDSALTVYTDVIAISPNIPEHYQYLAALYQETGRIDRALEVLDSAEVRFGIMENFSEFKRQLYIASGQQEKAIIESIVLTNNFPYDEQNYVILGELYLRSGEDSLALDAFGRALDIDNHSVEALASLANYYLSSNDLDNFLLYTQRLFDSEKIPLETKTEFFKDVIENARFYRDHYFRVTDLINTLIMRHPGEYEVTKLQAEHFLLSGNPKVALNVFKKSLADSVRIETLEAIIDIESFSGSKDSALFFIDEALKLYPDRTDLYLRKGYTLVSMDEYPKAEKEMEKALKYAGNDSVRSQIYSSIGDIRYAADSLDMKRLFPLYEKALKLNPDNVLALNNYSYYLSLEGKDLDKALVMIEKVMKLEPGNPTYIDTYGWVLFKLGRYEDAKRAMRQAVSLDPEGNKELFYHYGEVLHALGEDYMASVYWKKALEKGYDGEIIERRLKELEEKK